MAVTRTSVSSAMASGAAGITATFGSGATAGDFALLIIETANQTVAAPSGWTKAVESTGFGTPGAAGASRFILCSKSSITAGDISSGIAVADSGDHQNAILMTFSGASGSLVGGALNEVSVATTSATTNAVNIDAPSAVTQNDLLLAIICTDRDSSTASTNTSPSWSATGTNSFPANFSSLTGAGGGIIVNEFLPTAAVGAPDGTHQIVFTQTMTSSAYTSQIIVVKAAATNPTLTGQSLTTARGSVLAALALALTGGALTGSQGSVTPQISLAASGQSLSGAQGSISPSVTVALTGLSLSTAQGTVGVAQPVTGQETTATQGAVAPTTTVALTGLSLSVARGTVAPSNTETLGGQGLSAAQGVATPTNSKSLTGLSAIVARGIVAPSLNSGLSGQPLVVTTNTLTPTFSLGLSGGSVIVSRGIVTVASSDIIVALTGQSLTTGMGSITTAFTTGLTGQLVTLTQELLTPAGIELGLTGQAVGVKLGRLDAYAVSSIEVDVVSGLRASLLDQVRNSRQPYPRTTIVPRRS